MRRALDVASEGMTKGEMPIGAVVIADGVVVSEAHTRERSQRRLLVHADLLALDAADRVLGARSGVLRHRSAELILTYAAAAEEGCTREWARELASLGEE